LPKAPCSGRCSWWATTGEHGIREVQSQLSCARSLAFLHIKDISARVSTAPDPPSPATLPLQRSPELQQQQGSERSGGQHHPLIHPRALPWLAHQPPHPPCQPRPRGE
jgi:hypothetical protein